MRARALAVALLIAAAATAAPGVARAASARSARDTAAPRCGTATLKARPDGRWTLTLRCPGSVTAVAVATDAYLASVGRTVKAPHGGALACALVRRHPHDRTTKLACTTKPHHPVSGTLALVVGTAADPPCTLVMTAKVTTKPKPLSSSASARTGSCHPAGGGATTGTTPTTPVPSSPAPSPTIPTPTQPVPTTTSDPNNDYQLQYTHESDREFDGNLPVHDTLTVSDHETLTEKWAATGEVDLSGDPTEDTVKGAGNLTWQDHDYSSTEVNVGKAVAQSGDPNALCTLQFTDDLQSAPDRSLGVQVAHLGVADTKGTPTVTLHVDLLGARDDEGFARYPQTYQRATSILSGPCGGANSGQESEDLWGNEADNHYADDFQAYDRVTGKDYEDLSSGSKGLASVGATWQKDDDETTLADGTREKTVATLTIHFAAAPEDDDLPATGGWTDTYKIVEVETHSTAG